MYYKVIPNNEKYRISPCGEVVRFTSVKVYPSAKGDTVFLDGKQHLVNDLVLQASIQDDKSTRSAPRAKKRLSDDDYIYIMTNPYHLTVNELAKKFGITNLWVSRILKGEK